MQIQPAWPHLDPGECRERIVWQRKIVSGQDSFGQDVVGWSDVLTVYAKVVSSSGRETQNAQQRWAEADYVVSHNWAAGLRPDYRIVWRDGEGLDHYLDVLDISDREKRRMVLDVVAKEVQTPVVGGGAI